MNKTFYITNPFTKQKYAIDIHDCKPNQPIEVRKKTLTTKNTYEAAYYITGGAIFESASYRKLSQKKAEKRGYVEQWSITLKDVPEYMINAYRNGVGKVNIVSFESTRQSLKRRIKKYISEDKHTYQNVKKYLP